MSNCGFVPHQLRSGTAVTVWAVLSHEEILKAFAVIGIRCVQPLLNLSGVSIPAAGNSGLNRCYQPAYGVAESRESVSGWDSPWASAQNSIGSTSSLMSAAHTQCR